MGSNGGDAARVVDERPALFLVLFLLVTYGGLWVWALADNDPVLLAAATPTVRQMMYAQIASTSVAMLAVALTVLAILVALPDRPGVKDLRARDGWTILQGGLLATAALCLLCLVASHLGTALDNETRGKEWLSSLVVASAAAAVAAVMTFGTAFWLALRRSQDPADPSDKRAATNV